VVRVLDPLVSARIAAGEVIEQPASVVRELVDNALDAGARSITVELARGGIDRICVRDDGHGMREEDLPLVVQKHATSKICSIEDLETCLSMGFRGEALFAIASVARMRIVSNDGSGGHEIVVDNGVPEEPRAAPSPQGTSIEVRGLFQKLPARLAFLKSPAGETRTVRRVLVEKMLAWPGVRFVLLSDGDTVLNSAAGDLISRIGDIYGTDLVRELIPLDHEEQGICITGYMAPPHQTSATRREQVFIVNGRPLSMPFFTKALATGYGNTLPQGRHAIAFAALTMDPATLNVNVHPTKREIRFQAESAVFSVLVHAVRAALSSSARFAEGVLSEKAVQAAHAPLSVRDNLSVFLPFGGFARGGAYPPRGGLRAPPREEDAALGEARRSARDGGAGGSGAGEDGTPDDARDSEYGAYTDDAGAPMDGAFAGSRILGCFASNYWVYEQQGALFIVDQHAAHERVLYERFKSEYFAGGIARQALLIPITFTPHEGERELIEEQGALIQAAGYSLAPFGKRNWIIDEYPSGVKDILAALRSLLAVLAERPLAEPAEPAGSAAPDESADSAERMGLAERMDSAGRAALGDARTERTLATLACHAAVRQGDRISEAFLREILSGLSALEKPFTCPHGRPAIVRFAKEEIEKWFARR